MVPLGVPDSLLAVQGTNEYVRLRNRHDKAVSCAQEHTITETVMIIELSGKGILCDVFFVAATEFERIVGEYGETGIESKIRENCDESISVSRGFFFDGPYDNSIKLKFPNHEISTDCAERTLAEVEEWWRRALPETHPFAESDYWYETLCVHPDVTFPDPTEDQVAIVAYTEFEDGVSETEIEYSLDQLPDDFRIKCFDVDAYGFVGEVTYGDAVVGTEEYGYAESAIMGFLIDGKETVVSSPSFSQFRAREWLYRHDPEMGKHSMDFFGSKGFVWRDGGSKSGLVVSHSSTIICDDTNIRAIVAEEIETQGASADLNHLDVSGVTDLSGLFSDSQFNGDISGWDVSNVVDMNHLFDGTPFDGDISRWDVSSVADMSNMFWASQFNGDISGWDVSAVTNMHHMFVDSVFNGDISSWNVSNVRDMSYMFNCRFERFDGDLSRWDVSNVRDMTGMFAGASFEGDLSSWLVSPDCNTEDMFDDSFPEDFRPKVAAPLETLSVDSIPIDYDLDPKLARLINDYLNRQDLDWIKSNQAIVRKLLVSHSHLRGLLAEEPLELEVPEFSLESVDRDTCVLLSMFFEAYGVGGYDPGRLDDAALGGMTELRTLALGHESLFRSIHKSFCLHFDVLSEVSLGGPPSFTEMEHPNLIEAKIFVDEVLSDPDSSFNQR